MAGAGSIGLRWSCQLCWIPAGAQQQGVPVAQSLLQNNDFGANGGIVIVPGQGNPSGANIDTAFTTAVASMKAAFDTGANLAIVQGWQNGTG